MIEHIDKIFTQALINTLEDCAAFAVILAPFVMPFPKQQVQHEQL